MAGRWEHVEQTPTWRLKLRAETQDDLIRIVEDVADDARRGCPVDTGELLESIGTAYLPSVGFVYVGTDHWAPTEYGADPHPIDSHGPWPLRNRETGQVFGQHVNHPGNPAQPFMRSALYRIRETGEGE